jgi:hypothetical protein
MSSKPVKFTLVALGVAAGSFGLWSLGSAVLMDGERTTEHLVNQVWIERMPDDGRDATWSATSC